MENFIDLVSEVWNRGFFGIDLGSIISSLLIILAAFLLRGFIISVVINTLNKLAGNTKTEIDDEILNALKKPLGLIPITIALYICTLILPLTGLIDEIATNIAAARGRKLGGVLHPGNYSLLGVEAIFSLLENDTLLASKYSFSDFLSCVSRKAMHEVGAWLG